MFRIGFGYDVHQLVENRTLILGGVKIPHHLGLKGHSDADVLIHAIMDSILGALAKGDIGKHFPDNDAKYKNIDSMLLLKDVIKIMEKDSYQINNLDCTIVAQEPKLAPHLDLMKNKLTDSLKADKNQINIKATTTEELGFCGKKEGIAAYAVVSLIKD